MYSDDDDYNDEIGDVLADRDGYPEPLDDEGYDPERDDFENETDTPPDYIELETP